MRIVFILLLFLLCAPPVFAENPNGELLKVVVLSRHGVRAPTQSEHVLSLWSQKTWPKWPVKRGDLTPRGSELVRAMWENIAGELGALQILPENACPKQEDVYVRADIDERTRATAAAILEGIGPDCGLGYAVLKDADIDPLFHPVKAGLYRFNPINAVTSILRQSDGGLETLQEDSAADVALIGSIMGPPAPSLCSTFTMSPDCQLADLPTAISVAPDGKNIRIMGALDIASSVAEIFLLEYAEWPGEPAGWGQVNARILEQILPVHARIFDVVNRAPIVAWAKGSSLLTEIETALFSRNEDKRANDAKLVVFVGHDTNIANIGGLLNFNWQIKGYPKNGIPPASALFFELWRKDGQEYVLARFMAQPPAALHGKIRAKGKNADFAPATATVTSPPIVGVARFTPAEFSLLVTQKTEDAPIAPTANPPLDYNRSFPQ